MRDDNPDRLRGVRREIRDRGDREERRVPRRGHRNEEHRNKKRDVAQRSRSRKLSRYEDGKDDEREHEAVWLRHIGHAFLLDDPRWREEVASRGRPYREARRREKRRRDRHGDDADGETACIGPAEPELGAGDRGHGETESERRVEGRPDHDEHWRGHEEARSFRRRAKKKDERGEAEEAHELRAL